MHFNNALNESESIMNNSLRILLASGAATLGAAAFASTAAHATAAITVGHAGFCNPAAGIGGINFHVNNAQGLEYRLVMLHDGKEVMDTTAIVSSNSVDLDGMLAVFDTPVEATLTIDGQDYHHGPIVLFEVNGACNEAPAVHDIHASVDYLCIEGDPTINVTIDNDGDYTEPLSGMFVGESFETEVGAGQSTNAQKVVAAGAPYEFSIMSGQTTLLEDEGTMPDVCETLADTPSDQESAGQLPETGSGHTLTVVLAGLLLTLGSTLVRLTVRRRQMVWVETPQANDTV